MIVDNLVKRRQSAHSIALEMLILSTIVFAFTSFFLFCRVYTRIKARVFGLDDYLLIAAFVLVFVIWVMILICFHEGLGSTALASYTHETIGIFYIIYNLVFWPTYSWCQAFIKGSFIATIHKVFGQYIHKSILLVLVFLQFGFAIASTVIAYTNCRPLKAVWEWPPFSPQYCISTKTLNSLQFFIISFMLATDVICCLIPTYIMVKTKLPLRVKVSVCVIILLCLAASLVCIPRYQSLVQVRQTEQHNSNALFVTFGIPRYLLYGILEMQTGIIALSLTALKAPIERGLRRMNMLSKYSAGGSNYEFSSKEFTHAEFTQTLDSKA